MNNKNSMGHIYYSGDDEIQVPTKFMEQGSEENIKLFNKQIIPVLLFCKINIYL